MTSPADAQQRLQDLAWLWRVRDRIDREYAQPRDVEAPRSGRAHVGWSPDDIQRMNDLLLQLRDKCSTVLVVEHDPRRSLIR